jgi:hypothetical protein
VSKADFAELANLLKPAEIDTEIRAVLEAIVAVATATT